MLKNDQSYYGNNDDFERESYDHPLVSIGDVYRQNNLQKNYFKPGVTEPFSEIPEKFREDKMKYLIVEH